jgi:hypothetical protein
VGLDPRYGIRKKLSPDPDPGAKKATGLDLQQWYLLQFLFSLPFEAVDAYLIIKLWK